MKRRDFLDRGLRVGLLAGASLAVPAVRAADPLKVAVMIPLSGPAALFGPSSRSCAELAADEINSRGGILGRPVELLFGDGGLPPA